MYVSKLGNNADQYAIVEDGTGRTLAVTHSDQSGANAALFSAAPDLLAISTRLHLDINGRHATLRATSAEYRASGLCGAMDALIRDNAAIANT